MIRNRILRSVKILVVGLIILLLSYVFLFPQLFYCQVLPFSDFRRISSDVYISPSVAGKRYNDIRKSIAASQARIEAFYTGRNSRPVIIVCNNDLEYEKYCNSKEGAGCSLGTPWGAYYVVLNRQGINTDVISHEMGHIELLSRLGWFKTQAQVPQWFNEGLALMLDKRFVNNPDAAGTYMDYMQEWLYFSKNGRKKLELHQIASLSGFFSGDQQRTLFAYMTSGMEISYWLARGGTKCLPGFLRDMESGMSFEQAYAKSETEGLQRREIMLPANPLRLYRYHQSP
ncbi:hypothetical protein DYBT9275_03810 [Dyadobacter sp. CECT 9275]|uniref:Peptidase MA-like domain-containing protein n=1 Tax=Dyadobacter helix TaxID=2822344 RepID=A0A916JE56_9BACT|nr:hypothetical protein [Dyadobacter sp. CECT 9275]CAG5006395.1 hypothetical protein DYBT9275_03810 [Dyadobacter sp. CECT 9275]